MFHGLIGKRLTALFVLAFVCLNASGAACVAYCQTFDLAEAEHSSLQKGHQHCDKTSVPVSNSAANAAPGEADCCPFTISFLAAPVEKSSVSLQAVGPLPLQELPASLFLVAHQARSVERAAYRGPPLDRRVDRLKNCIIRI